MEEVTGPMGTPDTTLRATSPNLASPTPAARNLQTRRHRIGHDGSPDGEGGHQRGAGDSDAVDGRAHPALTAWARAAAVAVLVIAGLNCVGWASGIDLLTRGFPSSPQMPPWTAVLQAVAAGAILVLCGRPSAVRVWVGGGLAAASGLLGVVFLAEYLTNRSFGLTQVLFSEAVSTMPDTWPGRRPSPTASSSVLLVSVAAAVMHLDRRWTRVVWAVCLPAAVVMPILALLAELFGVDPLKGQALPSIVSVLLLVAAALLARPDRHPLAWLLARPDRRTLIQMAGIVSGLPILVGLARLVFLGVGVRPETERVLSLAVGTAVIGAAALYFFQREQRLLTEKEHRADAEARYRLLADNAVDVVAHVRGTEILWMSPSSEEAYGDPPEQWIGKDFTPRIHPDDLDTVITALQKGAADGSAGARCRILTASGDYRWVEFRGKPCFDARGNPQGVITSARIIDAQVAAEQQIKADAERFASIVENAPWAISVRDMQHRYTMVNDAFCQMLGHESAGDVIGRTEHEILSPDALERAQLAETRLLAGQSVIENESIKNGHGNTPVMTQRFPLRDSAGAITELVTMRTDITLRKRIEDQAADRVRWEERIWAAISDGRLLVFSQPIVDIATRETVAEELLVRLRAADSTDILPPSAFLPQCEKHGLIPVIDRYMVGNAIDLAHTGREVSVNITGRTIGDPTAMDEILAAITTAGPEVAQKMIFEITETMALTSPDTAKTFCERMRDLGCRVALDDFGTGYGGLTEIRHLDVDTLKIDRSFVQHMLEDDEDERVAKIVILVAREYGLTTVAEGVESEAALNRLAELGADRAQGYFFSKPKPVVW